MGPVPWTLSKQNGRRMALRAGSGKGVREKPSAFARVLQAVGPLPTQVRSDEISEMLTGSSVPEASP